MELCLQIKSFVCHLKLIIVIKDYLVFDIFKEGRFPLALLRKVNA